MLNARDTTLRADKAYIDLLEAESTWPFKYAVSRTNPVNPGAHPMWARRPGVPGWGVPTLNRLLPANFRMHTRASQNKPQTELFGTAPYMAQGRGALKHTDVSTLLQQGNWVPGRGSRTVTELDLHRFHFVSVPAPLAHLPFESRYGKLTRVGPEYVLQPHD